MKENGLHTLRGVDGFTTVINDIQQVIELSKKHGKWPLSLQMIITAEIISIALLVGAAIL